MAISGSSGYVSNRREYSAIFTQYIIQRTRFAMPARMPRIGIKTQQAQMHIASPIDCPGVGSATGMPRLTNSLCRDFARPKTMKKLKIRFTNGIRKSQTMPGSSVRELGAHLRKVFCRVRRYKIAAIRKGRQMRRKITSKIIICIG